MLIWRFDGPFTRYHADETGCRKRQHGRCWRQGLLLLSWIRAASQQRIWRPAVGSGSGMTVDDHSACGCMSGGARSELGGSTYETLQKVICVLLGHQDNLPDSLCLDHSGATTILVGASAVSREGCVSTIVQTNVSLADHQDQVVNSPAAKSAQLHKTLQQHMQHAATVKPEATTPFCAS